MRAIFDTNVLVSALLFEKSKPAQAFFAALKGDVDVLVSFAEEVGWSLWDLAEMQQELEGIFGRSVDLVENGTLRNPFRRQAILNNKVVVYVTV